MSKIILHIDLNTFFVRCEELINPSLVGKPVIIGHIGRGGIVSTCSYEARAKGASSGMPTYKAIALCPDAIVLPGNFQLYIKKSREFISFIKRYTSLVEQMSIDECFADFTKVLSEEKNPEAFLKKLQDDLLKETGLKCSIGVAPTRFLAKMGSDIKKPMGITIIRRKDVRKILDPLPIEAFFGLGKKTTPKLRKEGINTIGDLYNLIVKSEDSIEKPFGKFYYGIKEWIMGYGNDVVSPEPFDPKSIGHSTTFERDLSTYEEIKPYIIDISNEISQQADDKNKVGKKVQIVLKDNEFKSITRSRLLSKPTRDKKIIEEMALTLLSRNLDPAKQYRLVGVTLQDLIEPSELTVQMSIFDNFDEVKEECATKLLIGDLNRKMNASVFKTARDVLSEKGGKK